MILTIVSDKESNMTYAGIAATALCGAAVTHAFPGNILCRPNTAGGQGGAIEVMCDLAMAPATQAAFKSCGFQVIEAVRSFDPPNTGDPVVLNVAALLPAEKYPFSLEATAEFASGALCGAGLLQQFEEGGPVRGDYSHPFQVSCDSNNVDLVKAGFGAVYFTVSAS